MRVAIRGLGVNYRSRSGHLVPALLGVDLDLVSGQSVAVMGASGSGKSTLAKAIKRLAPISSGTVSYAYLPTGDTPQRPFTQRIVLVLQRPETTLFGETVFEDVALGLRVGNVAQSAVQARVAWALHAVGLSPDLSTADPLTLSGGQQRRVAIASALVVRPEILILDEPTAGLDAHARASVIRTLQSIAAAGVGLVTVTHSNRDALALSTRVVVLSAGRVVYDGPTELLLSDPSAAASIGLRAPLANRIAAEIASRRSVQAPPTCEQGMLADFIVDHIGVLR